MSDTERHIGKIKKVDLGELSVEEWCKNKCESLKIGLSPYHETYKKALLSQLFPPIALEVKGELWEVIEDWEDDYTGSLSILTPDIDGSYNYVMQFYNGATCLSEMLEEGIITIDTTMSFKKSDYRKTIQKGGY